MAKFKVGQRVKYTGHDKLIGGGPGSVGTVKHIDIELFGKEYPLYDVLIDGAPGGMTDPIGEDYLIAVNSCNSTNPIVRNAMAANACAKARAENASAFPPDLWGKLGGSMMAREAAGRLKRGDNIDVLIKRFRDSSIGSQIPGRAADAARVAYALEEMKRRGIA